MAKTISRKYDVVVLLPGMERMCIEERDNDRFQMLSSVDRIRHHVAIGALGADGTTPEELLDLLQDSNVRLQLIDLKARGYQPLPSSLRRRMGVDAYRKAPFPVDEAGNILWRDP
jgi:hypothetical protein